MLALALGFKALTSVSVQADSEYKRMRFSVTCGLVRVCLMASCPSPWAVDTAVFKIPLLLMLCARVPIALQIACVINCCTMFLNGIV